MSGHIFSFSDLESSLHVDGGDSRPLSLSSRLFLLGGDSAGRGLTLSCLLCFLTLQLFLSLLSLPPSLSVYLSVPLSISPHARPSICPHALSPSLSPHSLPPSISLSSLSPPSLSLQSLSSLSTSLPDSPVSLLTLPPSLSPNSFLTLSLSLQSLSLSLSSLSLSGLFPHSLPLSPVSLPLSLLTLSLRSLSSLSPSLSLSGPYPHSLVCLLLRGKRRISVLSLSFCLPPHLLQHTCFCLSSTYSHTLSLNTNRKQHMLSFKPQCTAKHTHAPAKGCGFAEVNC